MTIGYRRQNSVPHLNEGHKSGLLGEIPLLRFLHQSSIFVKNAKVSAKNFRLLFVLFILFIIPNTSLSQQNLQVCKIAIDSENEPFEFVNDQNQPDGLIYDLLHEIEKSSRVKFEFIPMNWNDALTAVQNGNIDLVSMVYSLERTKMYEFSKPFGQIAQALFRSINAPSITDTNSLSGYTVGFERGDISFQKMAHRKDFTVRLFDTKANGLLHLNTGNIDALFCTEFVGLNFISKYKFTNVEFVSGNLFTQDFEFATRKGNTGIIQMLNAGIEIVEKSGKLQKLKEKWLPQEPTAATWFQKNKNNLVKIFAFVGGVFLLLVLWNFSLQKKVTSKTNSLKINETLYRTLFDFSATGNLLLDEHGTILNANQILCNSLGYTPDELIGQNIKKILPKQNWEAADENIRQILSGKMMDHEVVNTKKNGQICYFRLKESTVILPDGKTGILSVSLDITAQKKIEEQNNLYLATLKESEEKYRALAETAPDMIMAYGFDFKLTYANKAATDFFRITSSDYLNIHIGNFVPPKYHSMLESNRQERLKGNQEKRTWELEVIGGDGSIVPVDVVTSPIVLDEKTVGFLSIIRNIADRKLAEEKIKESEAKYRLLVENAQDMVLTLNTEGILTYVSPSAEKFSGYKVSEQLGQHYLKFVADKNELGRAKEKWESVILKRETITYEVMYLAKTEDPFWVELLAKPIIENDEVVEVHCVMRNIEERKQAETKIQTQMEELQKWYSTTIGREERIIEMKKEVNELLKTSGKAKRYDV